MLGRAVDHPEGAGRNAEAAAVANILLDIHRPVLGTDQRSGGTHLEARRIGAMLADV